MVAALLTSGTRRGRIHLRGYKSETNLKSDYPRKVPSMCRRTRRYASTSNKFVPVVPDAHEAQRRKGRTLTWVTITLTLLLSRSAPHVTRSETQAKSLCGRPPLFCTYCARQGLSLRVGVRRRPCWPMDMEPGVGGSIYGVVLAWSVLTQQNLPLETLT